MSRLFPIVSGGQTGVDRAALDFALEKGIVCSGWCPKGRLAEDGVIDERYPLKETETIDFAQRTLRNVKMSDGSLIFVKNRIDNGTGQTLDFVEQFDKPLYIVHLNMNLEDQKKGVMAWLTDGNIKILNVAGPKESFCPGIYQITRHFLETFYERFII